MSIKAGIGTTELEQRAIDAHLKRLGFQVDYKTREIKEDPKARTKLEGGLDALSQVVGDQKIVELEHIAQVAESMGMGALLWNAAQSISGKDVKTRAREQLDAFIETAGSVGSAIAKIGQIPTTELPEALSKLSSRMSQLMKSHQDALQPSVLAHAQPNQLAALSDAMKGVLFAQTDMTNGMAKLLKDVPADQSRSATNRYFEVLQHLGKLFFSIPLFSPHQTQFPRIKGDAQGLAEYTMFFDNRTLLVEGELEHLKKEAERWGVTMEVSDLIAGGQKTNHSKVVVSGDWNEVDCFDSYFRLHQNQSNVHPEPSGLIRWLTGGVAAKSGKHIVFDKDVHVLCDKIAAQINRLADGGPITPETMKRMEGGYHLEGGYLQDLPAALGNLFEVMNAWPDGPITGDQIIELIGYTPTQLWAGGNIESLPKAQRPFIDASLALRGRTKDLMPPEDRQIMGEAVYQLNRGMDAASKLYNDKSMVRLSLDFDIMVDELTPKKRKKLSNKAQKYVDAFENPLPSIIERLDQLIASSIWTGPKKEKCKETLTAFRDNLAVFSEGTAAAYLNEQDSFKELAVQAREGSKEELAQQARTIEEQRPYEAWRNLATFVGAGEAQIFNVYMAG